MKNKGTQFLAEAAVIGAIYVVLTLLFAPLSYGAVSYTHLAKSNLPDRQSEMWYDVSWVHPLSLSLLPADH